MKTITIKNYMSWEDAVNWIRNNKTDLLTSTGNVKIDLSNVMDVPNNFLGFVINLFVHCQNNNRKIEVIPPGAGWIKTIFEKLERL